MCVIYSRLYFYNQDTIITRTESKRRNIQAMGGQKWKLKDFLVGDQAASCPPSHKFQAPEEVLRIWSDRGNQVSPSWKPHFQSGSALRGPLWGGSAPAWEDQRDPSQHHPMRDSGLNVTALPGQSKAVAGRPTLKFPAQPKMSAGAGSGALGAILCSILQCALQVAESALGFWSLLSEIPDDHVTSCSHARGPQKELAVVKSRQLQQVSDISMVERVLSLSFFQISLITDQCIFVAGHQKRILCSLIKPENNSKLWNHLSSGKCYCISCKRDKWRVRSQGSTPSK